MGISDFLTRMKTDRAFRGRMLAAGKDGLDAALCQEGYDFAAAELRDHLPQVRTGIQAGQGGPQDCLSCVPHEYIRRDTYCMGQSK
jgi:hypothetical protein